MYVEVTARQTGKTTRLVDSVIEFLTQNPNKSALIVSDKQKIRKLIQEKVHDKCGRPCEYRTITSYKMLPPTTNGTLKQFVDEFAFIDPTKLTIDENAYYTTTMSRSNLKALEIWEYYKSKEKRIQPNMILKKHKL